MWLLSIHSITFPLVACALQAARGLVVLKDVEVDEKQETAAGSLTLWQDVYDAQMWQGKTTLWQVRAKLKGGMKLPVPPTCLRLVPIKQEK